MQTRGRGGGGGEQRTLFNHQRYTMDSTAKESQIQSHKYTLILPLSLGDCSTIALEIAKEKTTIRHAPSFPIKAISTY